MANSTLLEQEQVEASDPTTTTGSRSLRVIAIAFALGVIALLGFGPSNIASEFGLSHSTANWVTWMAVYAGWEIAAWFPWLLPEEALVGSIYWWLGYAGTVNF